MAQSKIHSQYLGLYRVGASLAFSFAPRQQRFSLRTREKAPNECRGNHKCGGYATWIVSAGAENTDVRFLPARLLTYSAASAFSSN